MLLNLVGGLIENNYPVISAHYWPTNPKGRLSGNIRIEGNTFVDCGTTAFQSRLRYWFDVCGATHYSQIAILT